MSVLAGWGTEGDQIRILIGPSVVTADSRTLGWQARIDLSTSRIWGTSAIASGRTLVVPDYEREWFQTFSIAFGLRVSAF